MRCIGLRLLNCRFWQPAWLAVVLMPLAALSCCAAADQLRGDGEQHILAASADRLHGSPRAGRDIDRENLRPSTAQRQFGSFDRSSPGEGVGVVLKAAWPAGKSHLPRRGGQRWPVASLGGFVAMPPWSVSSASSMSMVSSVLAAEYALLRRLEL